MMKFFDYLSTLFVPNRMMKRKNISWLIAFLIILIGSYIIAVPYIVGLNNQKYELLETVENYNFRIFDDAYSSYVEEVTEEDSKACPDSTFISLEELKLLNFRIVNGIAVEDENNKYEIGKDYVVKRLVNFYNDENTIVEQKVYYIHFVFDIFTNTNDATYDIVKQFDTLDTEKDIFRHYLVLFNIDGFRIKNEFIKENNMISYGFEYRRIKLDFSEMEDLTYISKKLTDLLVPEIQNEYTFKSFVYSVIIPLLIMLVAWMFIKSKGKFKSFKNLFNIGCLISIPVIVIFFLFGWIKTIQLMGIIEWYPLLYAIYFCFCIGIILKNPQIE